MSIITNPKLSGYIRAQIIIILTEINMYSLMKAITQTNIQMRSTMMISESWNMQIESTASTMRLQECPIMIHGLILGMVTVDLD